MYKLVITQKAQKDYVYWRYSGNQGVLKKINALLEDIAAHPYTGIGKPEMLKHEMSGKWSRRINEEHRIVYSVNKNQIEIFVFSMRHHY